MSGSTVSSRVHERFSWEYVPWENHNLQVKQLRLDKQVLQAHEAATSALKTIRQAEGLSVERVADTLDAFAEVTHIGSGWVVFD